ncbi:MAG: DUF4325 domain-containing protein [Candidatus Taylorbacteria bacterium]
MLTKAKILEIARKKGKIFTRDIAKEFEVSRQYASILCTELVTERKLIKIGSTRNALYVLPEYAKNHKEILPARFKKTFTNVSLEEHTVLEEIEHAFVLLKKLPENVRSIFTYAFSEMVNNAIEHSGSKKISIELAIQDKILELIIDDSGIGVFRNIMQKRKLKSELEAIQDLLKGKTTTMPKSHSGEGIFFTSKVGEQFILDSFGRELIVDNKISDVFIKEAQKLKKGTRVIFTLNTESELHLNDIFRKYTNLGEESDYGFDKTEVRIKLYTIAGVHISRSQARRVLSGLEKFKIIVFDFDKVPLVGQAFADEVFRVFHHTHPKIELQEVHMNEGVRFMVERAKNEAKARS